MLPLAACASVPASDTVDLVRAGCPTDIRIQTDAPPRVEWGFLYGLLDADSVRVGDDRVSAPLILDGEPTGATLTILTGDPLDGVSANVQLHEDDDVLLGAVDTDIALLDFARYPTVGVFAPLARDPRLYFWDAGVYPGLRNVESFRATVTPDGAARIPVAAVPNDPFTGYAIGIGWLTAEQVVADPDLTLEGFVAAAGLHAQAGDALVDPTLLGRPGATPRPTRWQVLDDIGYSRDQGVLSAAPQTLVRYADCLTVLVPELQRALVAYLDDPEATNAVVVELAAQLGDEGYDAEVADAAFRELLAERYVGNGRDDTIGDIDLARVRGLFETAVPRWRDAEVTVPAGVTPDDIVTNRFIDRSIGR